MGRCRPVGRDRPHHRRRAPLTRTEEAAEAQAAAGLIGTHTDRRWLTGQLCALVRGRMPTAQERSCHDQIPPPGTNLGDQEQRNMWWHSVNRDRSLEEVLTMIPKHADALEAAIEAVPEEVLSLTYTFGDNAHTAQIRPARNGEPGSSLGSIIAAYANEYYDAHAADLRDAWARGLYNTVG